MTEEQLEQGMLDDACAAERRSKEEPAIPVVYLA